MAKKFYVPIRLQRLSSAPSSPPSGYLSVYVRDTDQVLRTKDSGGTERIASPHGFAGSGAPLQQFTADSYTNLTVSEVALTAGTYVFTYIMGIAAASGSPTPQIGLNGPTLTTLRAGFRSYRSTTTLSVQTLSAYDTATASAALSTTEGIAELSGFVTVSASGTFAVRIKRGAVAANVNVNWVQGQIVSAM